jgi:hypothetical protein
MTYDLSLTLLSLYYIGIVLTHHTRLSSGFRWEMLPVIISSPFDFLMITSTCFNFSATSLKCYVCSSVEDPKTCGAEKEHVDKKHILECDSESAKDLNPTLQPNQTWSVCRKLVTNIEFDVNESKWEYWHGRTR